MNHQPLTQKDIGSIILRIISSALTIMLVLPATFAAALLLTASGGSFSTMSGWAAEAAALNQRLGQAAPGYLRKEVCDDNNRIVEIASGNDRPPPLPVCESKKVIEVAKSEWIESWGKTLATLYWLLVPINLGIFIGFFPSSELHLRSRFANLVARPFKRENWG